MNLRFQLTCLMAAASLCLGCSGAIAQAWPAKPVRIVTESPAGAISDVALRAILPVVSARIGQPAVLENRAGANGIIAMEACIRAAPDGYTACTVSSNILSFNPNVFSKLPYDPEGDFRHITRTLFLVSGLVVSTSIPAGTVKELQALAVAKPGALNFGTLGAGSITDVLRQFMSQTWKTDIVGIPYKGGNLAAAALLAGEIQMASFGVGSIHGQLSTGKVRLIAINGGRRLKQLPDVPLFTEVGLHEGEPRTFWGISGPARMPDAVVARLNAEFAHALTDPKVGELLDSRFLEASPTSPQAFAEFLKADRAHVAELVRRYNVPRQ
jgi:tripartite-type tricarboxylate transporter receptor subunit TctC